MMAGVSLARVIGAVLLAGAAAQPALAAPLPKPPAFAVCGVCHKVADGEKSTIGPNLWGVSGRKAGTLAGFNYSPAMKSSNITWNRDKLLNFVQAPQKMIPGTKMVYAGQKDPKQAAAIVDYVLSLK
jgi:cytochrome c